MVDGLNLLNLLEIYLVVIKTFVRLHKVPAGGVFPTHIFKAASNEFSPYTMMADFSQLGHGLVFNFLYNLWVVYKG